MIDLSIIIPVYNVEPYLECCLCSVINIKDVSTQIICIDDASTDRSAEILNCFRPMNIEIYHNDENQGLAFSRNVGLEHARGRYIMFVDSDDYVATEAVSGFVRKMNQKSLDVLYFDVEEFGADGLDVDIDRRKRQNLYPVMTGLKLFDAMVKNEEMFGSVWSCIYRRSFIEKNALRFINGILHEDIPFTFQAIMSAERTGVAAEVGYYYRQRSGSILHQQNYLNRAKGLVVGYAQMLIVLMKVSKEKEMVFARASIYRYISSVVSMIEGNINKVEKQAVADDVVLNNFIMNIDLYKNKKYEMYFGDKLRELGGLKKIALYGAGKVAEEVIPFLQSKKISISVIFVSDIRGNKKEVMGIPVMEYNNMLGNSYDAIIIGVAKTKRIRQYLLDNGYLGKILW